MSAALAIFALLFAGTPNRVGEAASLNAKPDPARVMSHAGMGGATHCQSCHTASSWTEVKFDHDKTGFPLKGAHQTTDCKACHAKDFEAAVPTTCVGCHQDVHAGERGTRCQGCHDEQSSWRSRFTADGHVRTAFPLFGRHAAIPCEECHSDQANRGFSRATVSCVSCHVGDYQTATLKGVNHAALGFGEDCQSCHSFFRWSPAKFPAHDACFVISTGSHANIACSGCHQTVPKTPASGACNTLNAACTGCHTHQCTATGDQTPTDKLHTNVLGYQCKDRKCFECHRQAVAP